MVTGKEPFGQMGNPLWITRCNLQPDALEIIFPKFRNLNARLMAFTHFKNVGEELICESGGVGLGISRLAILATNGLNPLSVCGLLQPQSLGTQSPRILQCQELVTHFNVC